jgi:hypothetical protein
MVVLILFSLISTALFYLGSRALITRWLWSQYPQWLSHFMDCAACVGTWWGFVLAFVFGHYYNWAILGLHPHQWFTVALTGLALEVTTPIVAGLMQRGLDYTGTVHTGES